MTYTLPYLLPPTNDSQNSPLPVSAKGLEITYSDDSTALCGTSGVWNVALGYGNQAIADAIYNAATEASFFGLFRSIHTYAEMASQQLLESTRHKYRSVLYSTSGSAAVDCCLKLSRYIAFLRGSEHKKITLSFKGSYHGMTMSAMSVSGDELGQRLHLLDQSKVRLIDSSDPAVVDTVLQKYGERVAAVIIEPVLGTGTIPVSSEVILHLLSNREKYGYIVIADEVATGFGRTGEMFCSDSWNLAPDLLILSKALTNGTMAASAILLSEVIHNLLQESQAPIFHAETQGGSPLACAAILATLQQFQEQNVLDNSLQVGQWLTALLSELTDHEGLFVTGRGCFQTLHMRKRNTGERITPPEIMHLIERCRQGGITVYPGPSAIQFIPPLIYTQEKFAEFSNRFLDVWKKIRVELSV